MMSWRPFAGECRVLKLAVFGPGSGPTSSSAEFDGYRQSASLPASGIVGGLYSRPHSSALARRARTQPDLDFGIVVIETNAASKRREAIGWINIALF